MNQNTSYSSLNKTNQMNQNKTNHQFLVLPEEQTVQFTQDDFIKIERINENLKQLHVLGEIFAENGFLVRSDARSKTNIEEIHSALSGILSLVGVSYSYTNDDAEKRYGFIAQEVQKTYPDLVKEDSEGKLSVDYLGVIPILVEALKEIHANTVGLTGVDQMNSISNRTDEAINKLERVLFELDCVNPHKETLSQFEEWKSRVIHIFGPTPFLLFSCLFISIICIIIPIAICPLSILNQNNMFSKRSRVIILQISELIYRVR